MRRLDTTRRRLYTTIMHRLTPTMWNTVIAVVLTAGLGWMGLSRLAPGEGSSGRIPAPQVGFQAPDFNLPDAFGETVQLADLRGRPVLVNIWASWCPPCRAEMPAMQRAYQAFQEQGFVILAVNAADQDDRQQAQAFIEEQGLTFPVLFDVQGEVSRLYQVRALPSSFFIDAEGIIREVVIGGPMAEALLQVRVRQLLADPSGEAP